MERRTEGGRFLSRMKVSGVPQSPGRTRNAAGPVFDLMAAKLRRPAARPGTIPRFPLIGRLAASGSSPIVSVVAPSGYGKTTLLAQWAEREDQAFAWVSVDERDNDPKVLLSYVAAALDAVQPLDQRVFEALASPTSSVPGTVMPRLGSAFSALTVPVVLVLDDVHLLHNPECQDALSVLADHVPPGSRLALAARQPPPLRVARLRAEGRLLEIGSADLALDQADAAALLRAAEVTLDDDDVAVLHERTEGWAAGLYLAALFLLEGGSLDHAAMSFGGDDRLVSQYMESEFLARISPRHREFLTRTAVLERMSQPLCEAVLDTPGADMTLAELARSNLLLVPLDRDGQWYRYHHLFRDMLLAELERREPGLLPVLRRRAAAWCLSNDLPEEALEYAMAAGDVRMAADLVGTLAVPARRRGRITTLLRWLRWLEERGAINENPMVMVLAALIYAWLGQSAEAERWIDAVDHWQDANTIGPGDTAVRAWAALDQAFMCRWGVARMLADADRASRAFAAAGIATGAPALLQGIARVLSGDLRGSEAILADAVKLGQETGTRDIAAAALAERSLTAMARGDWTRADELAGQAETMLHLAGAEESYFAPLVCAVQARAAIHRGDVTTTQQQLVSAQRARGLLTYAVPHVAVQARIELTRVHLDLDDMAGARTLITEINEILERRPQLGTLVDEAGELRGRLSAERGPATPGASPLTTAELRVLPMLATHLSYPEIAAELSVSPNTIKSQTYSIFRKLGASSRSEAVIRSRELELLDG
jgi:LuxR family transcriptional regulator, maltose regulon positive regulatory protein